MKRIQCLSILLAFVLILSACMTSCDLQGEQGPQGEQGIQGEKGDQGEQGVQGEKGDRGEQGVQGEKGDQGEQGIQGEKGDQGEQGIQGEKGDRGEQGIQGEAGLSAFDIFLKYHPEYTGTEEEWSNGLSGQGTVPATGAFTYASSEDGHSYVLLSYEGEDRYVEIPMSYNGFAVTIIGRSAFEHNKKLKCVVVPDTVTIIEKFAFNSCENLKTVYIPISVKVIESAAFQGNDSLVDVYYQGSKEDWDHILVGDYNHSLSSATIHYNYQP